MLKLTIDNFENEVLKSDLPVLVDFWATWCGPCKMIAPEVEAFATENEGKIKVGKVDVDEEETLAIRYGIEVIPTLLVFKDGKVAGKSVGYCKKDDLKKLF